MLNPDVTVEELLMAPNSALKLQTNRWVVWLPRRFNCTKTAEIWMNEWMNSLVSLLAYVYTVLCDRLTKKKEDRNKFAHFTLIFIYPYNHEVFCPSILNRWPASQQTSTDATRAWRCRHVSPPCLQRWRECALLPDVGVPRPGGRRSGGQQGPPLVRLRRWHLLAARHVAGDLRCQSNPHRGREGQWPSGRVKAASTDASAAL